MIKILLIATLSLFGNSQVGEIAWFPSYCPAGWQTYVPLSGRIPIGSNTQFPLGSTGGEVEVTLSIDEMPNHGHDYTSSVQTQYFSQQGGTYGVAIPKLNVETSNVGGSQPHNNMPPYLSLQPCIRINATSTEELEKENLKLRERLDSLEKKLDKLTESLKN